MKAVLMIAFHYPPYQGSSGMLRTWNFSRHLPGFGWRPLVLTASERAYGMSRYSGGDSLHIPPDVQVFRAAALDAARQLAIQGRYFRALALPDRWISWWLPAVTRALIVVQRYRPNAIWSTYPIASAQLVALTVQRLTGLPWVADFRDSMTEENYPPDPRSRKAFLWIERKIIQRARHLVYTTDSTRAMYAARYSTHPAEKSSVIPNGFDEEDFKLAESLAPTTPPRGKPEKIRLVHSGILYPSERDPRPFLQALAELKHAGRVSSESLEVVFRASGHDADIGRLIEAHGLGDLVSLAEPLPYHWALAEMLNVDGLLLFQAANCNHQVPAKLYEYFRAGKPILALTDTLGDTAATIQAVGGGMVADLADSRDIVHKLPAFIDMVRTGEAPAAQRGAAEVFSRRSQAMNLAKLLDRVASCK